MVERQHLQRKAYVYVRRSTMAQVEHNTESLERQYELSERAVALGWSAADVVVVDSDLGRSGKSTEGRDGFQSLVAEVGLSRVGIVLGIEVSRLARRNADWYQLLDLCALTDTLIADSDGIYHPALHNDRLVLGLKGTMSEAELHVLRARLRGGSLHKAGKGKLRLPLPAGLEHDEVGRVRITPDEAVADAITMVFTYFEQLASARQVMLRMIEEDRKLPRKSSADRQVRWIKPSYKAIHDILTNPVFAGAYAYGRKQTERRVQDGVVRERVRRTPREEWHVCIEGHHPGYITFERYLQNQQRLRANWRAPRGEGGGAAREGRALLQGLIRCGRCGRKMQVGYSGKTLVPNYSCVRGTSYTAPSAASRSAAGGSSEWCSTPSSRRSNRPGSKRHSTRSNTLTTTIRRGCAPPSWRSSAHRSTLSARVVSSMPANPRTGSSPAPWSANGSSS
jgi:DNA invertase Pin-like site-specific DNA recombinase